LFVLDLPNPGASVEREVCVDTTRRTARLHLDAARVPAEARLSRGNIEALGAVATAGRALIAAEMVGAAEAVLEQTRRYACERQQFGRAIGSFQAVKHPIVDMMVGVELARSLALASATLLDRGPNAADTSARMAKALASDVFANAVKKGVQLHGGFGFTWDCDVHLFFKRMLWSRGTLGDAGHHRRHLANRLLGPA
jgi:alkylation response protein AidB-like acyl-CoA dehydrogenase